MIFEEHYPLNTILRTMYNFKHSKKWDKLVMGKEDFLFEKEDRSCFYSISKVKMPLKFQNRILVDKIMRFVEFTPEHPSGVFYLYASAVPPNIAAEKGSDPDFTLGETVVAMEKIYRRASDGKIQYDLLAQQDMKMKVTPALIKMFVGGEFKGRYD
eukprot:CAMPEP_0202971538 /NCGR_PEP_ID=MMETSP1396-20130829/28350_1 /ASSEMBLY_ACC=CAM_ASM_000872 /TAXON_ID= /ORGANISM="Pseudokeronopsis sp., Strain Brazil" /LENGTH=155 /DNA_ID=CAMNT_0049701019 /DNA_START=423 /DNA_END=887 /DNA_ORIENTATION=-